MSAFPPLRFLVVDDFRSMGQVIGHFLTQLGAKSVTHAENGSEAWDLLQKNRETDPLQFIISDLEMPMVSGLDLLKKCKSDPIYANIPFLILTKQTSGGAVSESLKVGVDGYLLKPLKKDVLRERVVSIWEKKSASK